jgi:hypothetical protein
MSDLQCPAVVLLIARELLTTDEVTAAFRGKHLAGVFVASSITDEVDLSAATRVAEGAGRTFERLTVGSARAGLIDAINQLSDLYRGETIAVVADAKTISGALGWDSAPTAPVTVAIDSSGWVLERS